MGLIERLERLATANSLGFDTKAACRDAALTLRRFVQAFDLGEGKPDRVAYAEFYRAMVWSGLRPMPPREARSALDDAKSAVAAIAIVRRVHGVLDAESGGVGAPWTAIALDIDDGCKVFREAAGIDPTFDDLGAMLTLGLLKGKFQPYSERELSLADEQVQAPPPPPWSKRAADAAEKIEAAVARFAAAAEVMAAAIAKGQQHASVSSWLAGREPGGMASADPPYTPVADICGWDLGAGMWARCARCRAELDLAERPPQCVDQPHPSELTEGLQE